MKVSEFKENLKMVFDDDLRTRPLKWNNYVDIAIIGVIVLSTIEVFLSTFEGIVERYGNILNFINWFTILFFTVEIALRIWTADLLDDKYKGFMGRLRYCCSFYGAVDIISTLPFYLNFILPTPYTILKVFRVLRLLRLFRYMRSSRLLMRAASSKKDELLTSMAFLALLTVILSFWLYFAEHAVQPELCENGWQSLMWAFAKYLGDPGKIADFTLLSPWANFIAFLVGILGVAIFAVPTGLISSGFVDAMDEEKRKAEISEFYKRMSKNFRRTGDKTLRRYLDEHPELCSDKYEKLNFVPSRVPVSRMQIRQGFEFKDIYEVCEEHCEFRLKNLAAARSLENNVEDRYVVEHYPVNRPYGYCSKDRHSKVTIVSTSSYAECGTGWFAYYLAKLGGFNYISKDVEVDPDELDSFFNLSKVPLYNKLSESSYDKKDKENKKAIEVLKKKEAHRKAFLDDLKEFAKSEDSWVILIASHIKNSTNSFDFHLADARKDGSAPTVHDQEQYKQFLQAFDQMMQSEYPLTTSLHSQRFSLTEKNLGYKLQENGLGCNTFVLRPSSEIINFSNYRLLLAFRIAHLLSQQFDNGKGVEEIDIEDFAQTCFGYRENKLT